MESTTGYDKKHVLLRRASVRKVDLKEKVVQIYECFFRGDDPSIGNLNFWDEFFLLKANTVFLENEIDKLNGEELLQMKDGFNQLFLHATTCLKQKHPIRSVNAIHTLCSLVRGVFRRSSGNYGFDVINLLIGFDSAESVMQTLIECLNVFLTGEHLVGLRSLALKFLLVILTATDNISQNTVLEFVMMNSMFESLVQILGHSSHRHAVGHDAALVLALLVQYRKYELANPYIVKLSILDEELALTGYAQVISTFLTRFNTECEKHCAESHSGWFSSIANMMGSMFVAEERQIQMVRVEGSLLLALYEAIHLNRNFITALTHSHTPTSPLSCASPAFFEVKDSTDLIGDSEIVTSETPSYTLPTSLLVTFLQYTSVILQDTKDSVRYGNAKLCLIILTCISEDQYANSLLHDANITFRVPLYRTPMRHRKIKVEVQPPLRPLIYSLLDLMVEFILSHMMKAFPMELYLRCLGIIHRVLCYQKKVRIRIQYSWRELWTALINLLKFILSHESQLIKKHNVFLLCSKIVNVFNMFVTYGDKFLPNPSSYDELYYEIVRMHQTFNNLYSLALRYTTNDRQYSESAVHLTNHLINIRAIINHFSSKVDNWASLNQQSSLTEDQVLEVVQSNYDSLTLRLQDSLDQFERYSEKPKEVAFFTSLVRSIICDVRRTVSTLSEYQSNFLNSNLPTSER